MLLLTFALIVTSLLILSCASRGKQPPGLLDGHLAPCPGSPNCVSSEETDSSAFTKPFIFDGEASVAWTTLKQIIVLHGGTIQQDDGEYLWATFTSRLFRFIDDVEFRVDVENQRIHVRSAARVGYSYLGVNRKRVAKLRQAFTQGQAPDQEK
ncbi:MAG: DUF1499 domain-containing protein [Desulfuromonas sp.]|nr:MAG: DUF1499 domain-containing protein [Desulfuromonas sp.]